MDKADVLNWGVYQADAQRVVQGGGKRIEDSDIFKGTVVWVRNYRYFRWRLVYHSLPIPIDSEFILQ